MSEGLSDAAGASAVTVSVLMPVYNAQSFLEQAVRSVLGQSHTSLELICLDDGSTDKSRSILDDLAATDTRIKVMAHPSNRGVGITRADCLKAAQGDYLLFVDADDSLEPDALEACLKEALPHRAELVVFKQDCHVPAAAWLVAKPPAAPSAKAVTGRDVLPTGFPASLNNRFCHGLWGKAFNCHGRDVADRIFQLGASLTTILFSAGFIARTGLSFGNYRVGEWIPFVNRALVLADRIVLVDRVLYHVNWWHGTNLTQTTLGNPRRYYDALLSLKNSLASLNLKQSYVNLAADLLADELTGQRDFIQFTEPAKFLRAFGFETLDIIGHPEHYYYHPETREALRAVVLGDVYSAPEQFIEDFKEKNSKLGDENRQLKKRIKALKPLGKRIRQRLAKESERLLGRFKGKRGNAREGHIPPSTMNRSTSHRFSCLCDHLLTMEPERLAEQRDELISSIQMLVDKIEDIAVFGKSGVTTSNQTYRALLRRLIETLKGATTPNLDKGLRSRLHSLKDLAATHTSEKVKVVFFLQEAQVFPSIESIHSSLVADDRFEAALVFVPLGDEGHAWDNRDSALYNKEGKVSVIAKKDYDLLKESPDLIVVTRPYFGEKGNRRYFSNDDDLLEIPEVATGGFRAVYVPYAFYDTLSDSTITFGYQKTMPRVAWKILAYSQQIVDNFVRYSVLEGRNAALLGAPRFDVSSGVNGFRSDELTSRYRDKIQGRPTLLWNTHFRNPQRNWRVFLTYLSHVIEYFESHPGLVLFWRPHPMMFKSLVSLDIMTQREIDNMMGHIAGLENVILDQSKDYINAFALSDAMLTDGDSSLPYEFIATGKPVYIHYVHGNQRAVWEQKYVGKMPSLYYPSFNLEDLDGYLEALAAGDDPQRETRLLEALRFIPDNDGQTGQRVVAYLYQELFAAERELAEEMFRSAEERLRAQSERRLPPASSLLENEAARVLAAIRKHRGPQGLAFALLTDTRYAERAGGAGAGGAGGAERAGADIWADTAASLRLVHQGVKFNRLIHLGDLTDGTADLPTTRAYVKRLYDDLNLTDAPLRVALGERDANGGDHNPEQLTVLEQSRLYLKAHKRFHYEDISGKHLRLVFLDSFDVEQRPHYGYSRDCIEWLRLVLEDTPPARRAIVFSHLPPVARLLDDVDELRGETELMEVLNGHAGHILGFIHGHTHRDYLDNEEAFPIVSIASASYACAADGAEGSPQQEPAQHVSLQQELLQQELPQHTSPQQAPPQQAPPQRKLGSITQECWDVLLVDPTLDTLRFIRFGAGNDRIVENGVAQWA
jgi:glycosyltransferase involved in cell wall biosynthesis